jgi:hypothetical protein
MGYNYSVNSNILAFASGAPEPAVWAMMLIGVAGVGGALRAGRAAPLRA